MVAEREKVQDRIARIRECTVLLEDLRKIELGKLKKNKERQFAILHALQLAIEACIEIGSHIVSADELGVPEDFAGIFRILAEKEILPDDFADEMKKMARFRNRLVHLYWDMDLEEVYQIIHKKLGDFDKYISFIGNYLSLM